MASTFPALSLTDNLRLNATHFIPYLTRGVITEQESRARFWARHQDDPGAVALIGSLREKYASEYLSVRLLARKALLVLGLEGIRRVLEHSPVIYGPAAQKTARMSHFQPHALTISTGAQWRQRRTFNEAVLGGADGTHAHADHFLDIVRAVVGERVEPGRSQSLAWPDIRQIFSRIMLQVVFGTGVRDERLAGHLEAMMLESNALIAPRRPSAHYEPFYRELGARLDAPTAPSLAAVCAATPSSASTRVANQVPHWMFALKDTLAINTARTLALIVSHPRVEQRVADDLARADRATVSGIARLAYLEGCLHEAMRLWPTTMMLVRETLRDDVVAGHAVPAGTTVIIHNGFNGRDAANDPHADALYPERWLQASDPWRFNHLSNGPQACAGKALALFIAKAVLATVLAGHRCRLLAPVLDPARPLPYVYDHYGIALELTPLRARVS